MVPFFVAACTNSLSIKFEWPLLLDFKYCQQLYWYLGFVVGTQSPGFFDNVFIFALDVTSRLRLGTQISSSTKSLQRKNKPRESHFNPPRLYIDRKPSLMEGLARVGSPRQESQSSRIILCCIMNM